MNAYRCVCSWCNVLIRAGVLPITHGMCPTCSARLHAEMDALKGTK
jgi:ferredoxin